MQSQLLTTSQTTTSPPPSHRPTTKEKGGKMLDGKISLPEMSNFNLYCEEL